MPRKSLTAKQSLFIREYLVDGNATQAAIRAGYSARTAEQLGHKLLQLPRVKAALEQAQAARAKRLEVKADDVLRELLRVGLSDIRQAFDAEGRLLPIQQLPEDVARAIAAVEVEQLFEGAGRDRFQAGVTVKVKLWDKPKALQLLGQHLKLYTERREIEVGETLAELVARSMRDDA